MTSGEDGRRRVRRQGVHRETAQLDDGIAPVGVATIRSRVRRDTLQHGSHGARPAAALAAARVRGREISVSLAGVVLLCHRGGA